MKNTSLLSLLLAFALVLNACNSQSKSTDEQSAVTETSADNTEVVSEEKTVPDASATTAGTEPGIQFSDAAWKAQLAKAKAEKKLVFLDAYTSWCGPCKLLQKNVFTQKEVGDFFNKEFINVKIDMEKGEGPELALQYPLEGYPTLLFIDGDGKVVKKVLGYQSPEELLTIGKGVKGQAAL
ncbi:thioredoxin family protein [Larkinella insperata]|uniref:Thioredoxin family protein n=1 Tax=Larkinella insperata TaxID=332158 RepID=A0ABW3QJH3_9BACT|nr:thioredoxin fold domain-containing protein [Larkinella insperata]